MACADGGALAHVPVVLSNMVWYKSSSVMYVRTTSPHAFGFLVPVRRPGANVADVSSSFQMYVPNNAFWRAAPVAGLMSSARASYRRASPSGAT